METPRADGPTGERMTGTGWPKELRPAARRVALVTLIVVLGVGLALLPLKWAAVLLAGSSAVVVLLIRPAAGLCLLPFAVPFGSLREVALGPVRIGGAELLIAALLAAWLAQGVARRRIRYSPVGSSPPGANGVPHLPLFFPLALFLGVLLLSVLPASSLELSAKEIVKWVEVAVVYGLVAEALDERTGRWVVWAMLGAASVEAGVGIYQFLNRIGPEGFVLFGRFMRAYGHFAQPNPFAGYLGLSIPLAYALTLDSLPSLWLALRRPSLRSLPLLLPALSLVVMGLAVGMSWSRGAWVGLAAALLVVTVLRSRRALLVAGVAGVIAAYVLAAGGARYLPPSLVQRAADLLPFAGGVDVATVEVNDANWAVLERMAHWMAAADMFTDHPWLGVGIGNYPVAYPQYAIGRWRDPLGHAHNYYLNIAAEAGLLGLSTFLVLIAACFRFGLRATRRASGPTWWRAVALGSLGVLVHLCVHNLFDNLFVHSMNVQLGLVLGLAVLAERFGTGQNVERA